MTTQQKHTRWTLTYEKNHQVPMDTFGFHEPLGLNLNGESLTLAEARFLADQLTRAAQTAERINHGAATGGIRDGSPVTISPFQHVPVFGPAVNEWAMRANRSPN